MNADDWYHLWCQGEYRVIADALIEAGDPAGEVIALWLEEGKADGDLPIPRILAYDDAVVTPAGALDCWIPTVTDYVLCDRVAGLLQGPPDSACALVRLSALLATVGAAPVPWVARRGWEERVIREQVWEQLALFRRGGDSAIRAAARVVSADSDAYRGNARSPCHEIGYQIVYYDVKEGDPICGRCVGGAVREEFRGAAFVWPWKGAGPRFVASLYHEGPDLECICCGTIMESDYGDPNEDDESDNAGQEEADGN